MNRELPPDPKLDAALADWSAQTVAPEVTAEQAERLVARAQAGRSNRVPWAVVALAATTLIAVGGFGAVGLGGAGWLTLDPIDVAPTQVAAAPAYVPSISLDDDGYGTVEGNRLRATTGVMLAAVDGDRLALGPGATVFVNGPPEARVLVLDGGEMAVHVAERSTDVAMTVSVADLVIRVMGSQIQVNHQPDEIRVAVAEGRVRVHHGRRTWTVEAGEALLWNPVTPAIRPVQVVAMMQLFEPPAQIDAVEPPSVSDAKPWDVSEVKRQIVSGDANGAIRVLQEHLRSVPDDAEAWSLLADAHLRNGAKKQAVVSWKRAADHANPAAASQARFKAAAVLADEGDWSSAAELYRRVLDGRPGALALDARLGLGESLLRSGQLELGRSTLIGLVSDQPASSPAKQASVVLSEFQGQE